MRMTGPLLLALAYTCGCYWGPRVEKFPTARAPGGASMVVDARPGAPFEAELLAVADSGLLVARAGRVTFVPYATIALARVVGLRADHEIAGGAAAAGQRARLRLVSRFPQGLNDELLARLLRAYGQDTVHRAAASPAPARDTARDTAPADLAERAAAGTIAFRDRRAAIAAGYRRLGMDFPAMGEHWVNPGLVIEGRFDAARPAMLSYVRVRGEPRLVGVVYAVPLAPGQAAPAIPGDPRLWHEHNGTIDEESLLPAHGGEGDDDGMDGHAHHAAAADDGRGVRLAILHAWIATPNPAGLFAADNWALPFVRLGLAVPARVDPLAARALSLASGGEAYWLTLVANGAPLAPAVDAAVRDALGEARTAVVGIVARERGDATLTTAELDALRDAWQRVVARVAAAASPAAAARLRGEG